MGEAKHAVSSREEKHEEILEELEDELSAIHDRILAIQETSVDDATFCEATCELQDEYNELFEVIETEETLFSSLPDPLEALPVEIWSQIIRDAADLAPYESIPLTDGLFQLMFVSKMWFNKLTGNARIWADIHLNERLDDYAAKAQIRLYLSKNSLLRINSNLSKEKWLQFLPLLQPHASRIVKLAQYNTNLLNELPALLSLRYLYSSMRSEYEAQQVELIDPGCMPLLETFEAYPDRVLVTWSWFPFVVDLSYNSPELSEEDIRSWQRAHNLRSLNIIEDHAVERHRTDTINLLDLSLMYLNYSGPNVKQALTWVGTSLLELKITCGSASQLWDIAHAVVYATSLELLEISTTSTIEEVVPYKNYAAEPFSVRQTSRTLTLRFENHPLVPYSAKWAQWSRSLHQVLPLAFPQVHDLSINVELMTLELLTYIEGLRKLERMDIHYAHLDDVGDFVLKVSTELLLGRWSRVHGMTGLFGFPDGTYDPKDLLLDIEFIRNDTIMDEYQVMLPLSFGEAFPYQSGSAVGLLDTNGGECLLHGIQVLSIPRSGDVVFNDFVESLALCPSSHPNLEQIRGLVDMIEWDILILMLERRNLSPGLEASPIYQIMLNDDIPGHLRHVMKRLLSANYPFRRALSEYSLEAIGRRMFDSDRTGCMRCCHLLRDCDSPVEAPGIEPLDNRYDYGFFKTYRALYDQHAKEYALPQDYMTANPPLSPYEAAWLVGKRQRRQEFALGFKESLKRFQRKESCKDGSSYSTLW